MHLRCAKVRKWRLAPLAGSGNELRSHRPPTTPVVSQVNRPALGLSVAPCSDVASMVAGTHPSIAFETGAVGFLGSPFGTLGGGAITFRNVHIYHDATPATSQATVTPTVGEHGEGMLCNQR